MRAHLAPWRPSSSALLGQVRWVFLLAGLVSSAAVVPQAVLAPTPLGLRLSALIAAAVLGWRSARLYRHGAGAGLWEPIEAGLLCLITASLGLTGTIALFYITLCARTLYPSLPRTTVRALTYAAGTVVGIKLSGVPPGIVSSQISGQMFGVLVGSVLLHVLARALVAQEQAVQREQALRAAGELLLAATDRTGLYAAVQAAYTAVLAPIPDAWASLLIRADTAFVRVAQSGAPTGAEDDGRVSLAAMSAALVDDLVAERPVVREGAAAANVATALDVTTPVGALVLTPLVRQGQLRGAILLARPVPFPPEAMAMVAVLTAQVLLALQSLDLTEDLLQRRGEERLSALVQHAADLILVVDAGGTLTYVSPSVRPALGYAPEALIGTPLRAVLHPADQAHLWHYDDAGNLEGVRPAMSEIRLRHRDGTWRVMEAHDTDLRADPRVGGVVLTARDTTERKRFEEQLRHQAFHDALTGLPNRALFLDRVEHALMHTRRHEGSVGVLFLDLDRFKLVNDSLGHAAGDLLLGTVAARLKECLRDEDTVARFGGDEFAILMSAMEEPSAALRLAERVIQALDAPFHLDGHDVVTATSIGIVVSAAGHTPADMLRDADVALYRAKARGRGRYEVFDATMNAQALERLELEADLRLALERGEFRVYYQPKMALASGRLDGLEALVRWAHPRRGLVSPAAFIPLAEETGLIRPLGLWVLEEACRQTKRWHDQTPDLALVTSVNLSARQFQQPTLVADVAAALQQSGVRPGHIQLEITESAAMDDAEAAVATLQQLKNLGVQLAIDDFGTGYSSLAYLKRFPVDALKIDRAFVSGLARSSEDASIVKAVASLGHALNLSIVAEGIETAEESRQVHALGCAVGQGYYFAKPLALADADAFVRRMGRASEAA